MQANPWRDDAAILAYITAICSRIVGRRTVLLNKAISAALFEYYVRGVPLRFIGRRVKSALRPEWTFYRHHAFILDCPAESDSETGVFDPADHRTPLTELLQDEEAKRVERFVNQQRPALRTVLLKKMGLTDAALTATERSAWSRSLPSLRVQARKFLAAA
jgi:hypothetical protein